MDILMILPASLDELGFDPEDSISPLAARDGDQANLAFQVKLYAERQARVDELTAQLTEANALLTASREADLPEALRACHYSAPTKIVVSGFPVEFKDEFNGKKLSDPAAHAWLDENGHGDLAKNVLTVRFNKGDSEVAQELLTIVRSHPAANRLGCDLARWVEAQTIAAFARESCGNGDNPPLALLGVSRRQNAKVSQPKEKL
jgi:hypothetical protein